ncbi:MAG: type II toxin-antitoxin system Phd/YefM family antitoxin [Smithella sp.]|nr:type II toxin-antitoxin system Phd/YefM family antitoxin [Smithella sp.]
MSLSISEDIKTVSDLKKKTNEIFKQLHHTGRPIIVTVNGKPDAILMDVDVFEKKMKALNLGLLLAQAEKDVKDGRTKDARIFLKEIKKSAKISS